MGRPVKDYSGMRFGRLLAIKNVGKRPGCLNYFWLCQCDCGNTKVVSGGHLKDGNIRSCGCLLAEARSANGKSTARHGMNGTATYRSWQCMIQRCENPKHKEYRNYGGAGISVCSRWRASFSLFLEDMGVRPPGTTLDRLDGKLGYCKDNCRWATPEQQINNRSNTVFMALDGRRMPASAWAKELGIKRRTLHSRIQLGWTDEESLTTPVQKRRNLASRSSS